ncbi:hypothetical protein [Shewanella violacea]|uniref:Uncharacterized protein n=1 Tax=Shewanella violacea (strain JCM 10179 / CIP 106290 / LMG 19151 / DSS12) TaxID=637905 RepID=D4ZBE9_SHEVD|nr:hypothetical protein [Shewanella violacea]BAJ03344.1 hypothetical protein SVI_3373 [Shewanella violacea DSS12]
MSLGVLHDNYNAHAELNDAAGNPVTTYIAARDNMLKRKENARLFTCQSWSHGGLEKRKEKRILRGIGYK